MTGLTRRAFAKQTIPTLERLGCGSCNGPLLAGELFCSTCGARTPAGPSGAGAHEDTRITILRKLEQATIGKLEFVRELGRGGMGIVYLARDVELHRFVAVKVLASSWLTDDGMVERFRREARTIASLRHPSIVHVHGVGKADDLHYFAMDFIEGVSLSQILRTHGPLSLAAAQTVFYQVGSALSYAHRPGRGVIHRDIKPGNIMLDVEGNAVVMDFGISKVSEAHAGLTMTGLIMGTPEYMSPEQCRGTGVTQASDQYALGAVVYAMLAGSPPFTGPHYEVLVAHTTQAPRSILEVRPDCPGSVVHAVSRMLEKIPAGRWPDIQDALTAAGIRPPTTDDPGREELARLVRGMIGPQTSAAHAAAADAGRTPTWLRILDLPEPIETGDAVDLDAVLGFADGEQIRAGEEVAWESRDPAVATIDPDTGQLVAVGPGSAVITAKAGGVHGSVAVAVRAPRVVRLVIEPDGLEIEAGETTQLSARARGRQGNDLERTVLWSSSDPNVVSVTESGGVHAYGVGSAHVLAHCEGVGAATTVRVTPAKVAGLSLLDVPASMAVGDTVFLRAEVRGKQDRLLDRDVIWSTADAAVARISPAGGLKALTPGRIHVTAECEGQRATASISILPAPVARITLIDPPSTLRVDERVHFRAATFDRKENALEREIAWSADDPAVLEVDAAGWARGLRTGATGIVAACEGQKARAAVEVRPLPAVAIGMSPPPDQLLVGDTFHLTAKPLDARGRPLQRDVSWQADRGGVVQSLGDGRFVAAGAGHATVTAEVDGVTGFARLVVAHIAVQSLTLRNTPETLELGDRLMLHADIRDQRNRVLQRPIRWTTDRPDVARIAADGLLEVVGPGTVTITAECAGVRAAAKIEALGTVVAPFPPPVLRHEPVLPPPERSEDTEVAVPAAPEVSRVEAARMPGKSSGAKQRIAVFGLGAALVAAIAWFGITQLRPTTSPPPQAQPAPPAVADLVILDAADGRRVEGGLELALGDTVVLRAAAMDSLGTPLTEPAVLLRSRDPMVARIDASGALVTLASGTATLVASASGIEREIRISITDKPQLPGPTPGPAPVSGPPPAPPPAVAQGRLQLVVQPWAHVTVDESRRFREVQRQEFRLAPGTHSLRLENPNMMTIDTTFVITEGAITRMRILMPPRSR